MFEIVGYILLFVAGLFIGSFLNVISDRSVKGESALKGRSHCDACKAILKPLDLVPLLSFVWLKAKCRYCKEKLTWYYPFSEVLTGLFFVAIAYYLNIFSGTTVFSWLNYLYFAILSCFLIVLLLTDMKFKLIPNKIVIPAILYVLISMILTISILAYVSYSQMKADPFGQYLIQVGYWWDQMYGVIQNAILAIVSALLIAGFFWVLILITKGKGMGGGDVKLAFLIGLINGFPYNLVAIIIAFITGAVFSTSLIALKRKGMKDVIPFGPFLILGCVLAFAFGRYLFNWYINLL